MFDKPKIDPTSRIASSAVISGDVTIGPGCSIGHGAVIVAEGGSVTIGRACVIMEHAVLRGVPGAPLVIGDCVMVGPLTHLVGCTLADEVFIATGARVFNRAQIGQGAEVRINAVVHLCTVLDAGATVPIGWVAVGNPAEILSPDQHDRIWAIQKDLDFPKVAFGRDRPPEGQSLMAEVMPAYAKSLARRYPDDRRD